MAIERTVLTRLKMDVSDFVRGAAEAAAATKELTNSIDKTNDRTAWLAQGILALAPALVPIGAAAVPAITGLATEMGVAALAAGTALLAFQGIGAGLTALNKYQLEPTAENLAKVKEQFGKLGPAGTDFVLFLDQLQPKLQNLQAIARQGFFPGLEDGITAALTRLPQLRDLVHTLSTTMGDLSSQAGHALGGPEWDHFFNFLEAQARPTLIDTGKAFGNFALGAANLLAAFAPASRSFSDGLLKMSQAFAQWSTTLDSNQAFQDFVEYVHESGPQVRALVGSIIEVLVQLTEAAAPVGHVMLPLLTDVLHIFAQLANSPLGSVFVGAAAAMSIYGRAAALASVTTGGLASKMFPATRAMIEQRGAIASLIPGMEKYGLLLGGMQDKTTRSTVAQQGFFRSIRPAVAGLGLMAASMTNFDDKMGLSNTTMLAMAGAMAGPWGAAIGASVGALLDAAHANDSFYTSMKHTTDLLHSGTTDFTSLNQSLDSARQHFDDFKTSLGLEGGASAMETFLKSFKPAGLKNTFEGWFGQSDVEEMQSRLKSAEQGISQYQQAWSGLINALHGTGLSGTVDFTKNLPQLSKYASSIQPALDALGLTITDLGRGSTAYQQNVQAIKGWLAAQDSVAGRTKAVGSAIRDLNDGLLSTAKSADQLAGALTALIQPGLDAEKATDTLHQSLTDMKDGLKNTKVGFDGYTAAALKNRDVTRTVAENTVAMLSAMAKNGDAPRQLASALQDARQEFIKEGEAAGFSHRQIVARANAIGLTPKLVRTVFDAAGIDIEARRIRQLKDDINHLPKHVQTELKQRGYDLSNRQIQQLKREYHLTPQQVKTVIEARDHASKLVDHVRKNVEKLNKTTYTALLNADYRKALSGIGLVDSKGKAVDKAKYSPTVDAQNKPAMSKIQQVKTAGQQLDHLRFVPTIDANNSGAFAAMNSVRSALNSIPDETVYINVKRRGAQADGGIVTGGYGDSGRYYPRQSQIVPGGANILWAEPETGREAYISDKPAARLRNIGLLQQVAGWFDTALVQQQAANGALFERQAAIASSARPLPATVVQAAGRSATVNMNGPIYTYDPNETARVIEQRERDALALAAS